MPPRPRGQPGKKDLGRLSLREMLNKTMPLVHPVSPVAVLVGIRPTRDDKVTHRLPVEAAPQGTPKGRIEEGFLHRNQKGRVIVRARPRRVFAGGAGVDRGDAVSAVQVVPAFNGFFLWPPGSSWVGSPGAARERRDSLA
jgi:hypothetical protein